MKQSDQPKFGALLRDAMAFYKQDVTPFALSVWWQACERYDFEQVSKALTKHAMDAERGQFAPKPADLVRQLDGTPTDRAMMAWSKVMEAIQRIGQYTDVVFDDPAIHAVIEDLGGWSKVCRVEMSELSYLQHRFTESHRAYCNKGDFAYPRKLMGDRSPDEMFLRRGLKVPAPAVVGEVEKARLVYRGGHVAGKSARVTLNMADEALKLIGNAVAKGEILDAT